MMQEEADHYGNKEVWNFLETRSEASFLLLYNKYNTALYRIASSFMNFNEDDACDVLQESWLTSIRKLGSFRGESTFKTWITSIVINKCREKIRERMKHNGEALDAAHVINRSVETVVDKGIDIQSALARLAPGQRQILVLHDMEGFKHEEIAMLLEISVGTSKSQLFDARKSFRLFFSETIR